MWSPQVTDTTSSFSGRFLPVSGTAFEQTGTVLTSPSTPSFLFAANPMMLNGKSFGGTWSVS